MTFDKVLLAMREQGKGATRKGLSAPLRFIDGLIYEGDSRIWVPYPSQIVADDWEVVSIE